MPKLTPCCQSSLMSASYGVPRSMVGSIKVAVSPRRGRVRCAQFAQVDARDSRRQRVSSAVNSSESNSEASADRSKIGNQMPEYYRPMSMAFEVTGW